MIQAVKAWHAVAAVLLWFGARDGRAAEDSTAAARELARKTATIARAEPVSISWRNLTSLDAQSLAQIRAAFDAAWQEAGVRPAAADASGLSLSITVSQNPAAYLLIAELQGEDRRVWIASWNRGGPPKMAAPGIAIDKKLLWEQDAPILDVALLGGSMVVLSPAGVTVYERAGSDWQAKQSGSIMGQRPWPRDLRGRLRPNGAGLQALMPGVACTVGVAPALTLDCRPSDQPWVLESGGRYLLLANYAPAANYFDGRVVTQSGTPKTVPPFYSAAAAAEQGRPLWLLATVEGSTQLFDAQFAPAGSIANWGSDIAGTDAPCAARPQILATRPGDASSGDAVQAFAIAARTATPVAGPVLFSGPVTALWPNSPTSAVAVVKDSSTGTFSAYLLTVTCGS